MQGDMNAKAATNLMKPMNLMLKHTVTANAHTYFPRLVSLTQAELHFPISPS